MMRIEAKLSQTAGAIPGMSQNPQSKMSLGKPGSWNIKGQETFFSKGLLTPSDQFNHV